MGGPLHFNAVFVFALLATCFHAGYLLGLLSDSEDGGNMFLRNVGLHSATTRRYIPENSIINHRCENLKSYKGKVPVLNYLSTTL
jgi:hypothetical protein